LLLARTGERDPNKPLRNLTLFFTEFDRARITVQEIEKLGRAAVDSNEIFIDGLEIPRRTSSARWAAASTTSSTRSTRSVC